MPENPNPLKGAPRGDSVTLRLKVLMGQKSLERAPTQDGDAEARQYRASRSRIGKATNTTRPDLVARSTFK